MSKAYLGDSFTGHTGDAGNSFSTPSPAQAKTDLSDASARLRRLLLWVALALPVVAWTALYAGAATPLAGALEQRATEALGREVIIGGTLRVLVTPFSVYLTAGDVRISNPRWAMDDTLLNAGTVMTRLSTFDLLIGRSGIRALTVKDGTLDLERSRHSGKTNWQLGKPGTLFDLASVRQIDADGLAVRYRDFDGNIETRLTLASAGQGLIAFSGNGKAGDRSFSLRGRALSSDDHATTFEIAARSGGIDLGIQGKAAGPLRLGAADITATAKGGDFSQLAALAGLSLPTMPSYALKANIGYAPHAWHFGRIEGRIGKSDLQGKLTLDQRHARPRIVAQLASRALDMGDGMALIGLRTDPAPIDMPDAGLHLSQRLLPDADISSAALKRFDAVIDYEADRVTGGVQMPTQLSFKLTLVKGVLTLSPATIDIAGGFISSDIMIDGRQTPALARYDIRLSPTSMGRLLPQWGIEPAGTTAMAKGRVQLVGRGETLRDTLANASGRIALIIPKGDLRTQRASNAVIDLANLNAALFDAPKPGPAQVNCGLIAFTVQHGVATTDPILIDTARNVTTGHGRIDLRDETIDLRLSAQGKSFAFAGRASPITVRGTFADPVVMREPVSWFRSASIFGIPMTIPDLGAIFRFVDAGDASDVACGPVLRGAPGAAQRDLASLR